MQYSFVKSLLDSTWMIHPGAASAYFPMFKGALSGLEFAPEPEPENSIPYLISANNGNAIPFNDPDDLEFAAEGDEYIFVLNLRGTIIKHDAMCGPRGTRTLAARLAKMDRQKNVLGHVIVTESGGGMTAAVPEMADAIQALTKPVVAWIDGMSASAAYYINSYCSHIMASRATDQVGCIGTLVQLQGYPKYAKLDDGTVVARIYSDAATEKNDEYETALEGNFKLVKERILNPHNEQFIADVKGNRPTVLEEQLKGRTYNAGDVVGSLIDSVGSLNDAVDLVNSLANLTTTEATTTKSNNNNTRAMSKFKNINKIQSINEFEIVDGHASFNEDQLTDIDQELSTGAEATGRLAELEAQNTSFTERISERDARIAELETGLAEALGDESVESSQVRKEADGGQQGSENDTFHSAFDYCENHVKNFK